MMKMQPIETAPTETKVLLYWEKSEHIEDGMIYMDVNDDRRHVLFDGEALNEQPTHWAELKIEFCEVE